MSTNNNLFLGEMAELTTKLACAAEGERRAKEQLEIRKDERNTEVTDLQNEVTWFRGEYDQLLLKVCFLYGRGHLRSSRVIQGSFYFLRLFEAFWSLSENIHILNISISTSFEKTYFEKLGIE